VLVIDLEGVKVVDGDPGERALAAHLGGRPPTGQDGSIPPSMHHRVELDKRFLERLRTGPRKAIAELLWNALDGDADVVEVRLERQALGGVSRIVIVDDGHGMTVEDATEGFSRLGGSWKARASTTREKGRSLHGREGRGRFFAAALSGHTRWESVAQVSATERRLTVIDIFGSELDDVQIQDLGATDRAAGTVVIVENFAEPPTGVEADVAADALTAEFAVYLTKYPVEITYDGVPLDPKPLQTDVTTYPLDAPDEEPAELDIVEWEKDMGRRLYLCDLSGTAFKDMVAGVHAPGFNFTAYARWNGFVADAAMELVELDSGPRSEVIEAARDRLREHFRERAISRQREVIEAWKAREVYPYTEPPADELEQTSRELFDVVAFTAREAVGVDDRTQRFSLRLLKEALERDPGHLRRVLEEVLDLDETKLADLNALLDRTTLAAIVAAGRSITDRLDFLRGLEEMVFDPEVRGRTLERSQLHRMLANETWLFGEEFHLVADDESLTNVLRRHLRILERDEMAARPVTDAEGRTRIVDLMLGKSIENARDRREHLVVELKAPAVKLGHRELAQIRDYATAVANDMQFDKDRTWWDFWVVSTDIADAVRQQTVQRDRPVGLIDEYADVNVRIWAKTWGQIIEDARHRLKFVRRQLNYASGRDEAIEYLHERYREFIPQPLRRDDEADGESDDY
jgi:hypothetical protein